jgi:hypothetical protein
VDSRLLTLQVTELPVIEMAPEMVDDHGVVGVLMGVDTTENPTGSPPPQVGPVAAGPVAAG